MSRHNTDTPNGGMLTVGWDPPLHTYFAQVYQPEPEGMCEDPDCDLRDVPGLTQHRLDQCQDNNPVVWIGLMGEEVRTVEDLADKLGSEMWALVSEDVRRALYIEHPGCPKDTDGDGNCGQRLCPYCGGDVRHG